MCRLLCEVSADCQAVLRTLLDREVRGGLITILRGKGEMLYRVLCGLWSWVSSMERFQQKAAMKIGKERRRTGRVVTSITDDRSCQLCVSRTTSRARSYCYHNHVQTKNSSQIIRFMCYFCLRIINQQRPTLIHVSFTLH